MEPIFNYTDYRKYLNDFYNYQKKNSNYFSYRYFSKKVGFSSPSWLKFIISGQRNLTQESTEKFVEALGLKKKEATYFRSLVNFNQAKGEKLKNRYFNDLVNANEISSKKVIDKDQYEFYSKWYYAAIRELIGFDNFIEDPNIIAKKLKPNIKPSDVRKALKILKNLKFVKYDKSKNLVQSDPVLTTGDEIKSFMIQNFHRQMILLAHDSIERFLSDEREVSSLTVSVSNKCFKEIKNRITNFQDELLELIRKDREKSQSIYQLNFQLFPLTEEKNV